MRYVFGHYTLDTARQECSHDGQALTLRPKVFLLLVYLVQHRERVVPKSELLAQLWPETFTGDATLNTCLKELRQAVGERGRTPQMIHTLRGRGYRFVAPVEIESDPASRAPLPSPTALAPREPDPVEVLQTFQTSTDIYKQVTALACALAADTPGAGEPDAEGRHAQMQALFTQA